MIGARVVGAPGTIEVRAVLDLAAMNWLASASVLNFLKTAPWKPFTWASHSSLVEVNEGRTTCWMKCIPGAIDARDSANPHCIVAMFGDLGHCGVSGMWVTAGRKMCRDGTCCCCGCEAGTGNGNQGV